MPPDAALAESYRRTTFRVTDTSSAIDIRVGARCLELDALLGKHEATCWAFITAWNPGSAKLDSAENRRRQIALEAEVKQRSYVVYHGVGVPEVGEWDPEESILVIGIDREEATKLGNTYGQAAIVVGEQGANAELLFVS